MNTCEFTIDKDTPKNLSLYCINMIFENNCVITNILAYSPPFSGYLNITLDRLMEHFDRSKISPVTSIEFKITFVSQIENMAEYVASEIKKHKENIEQLEKCYSLEIEAKGESHGVWK